MGFVVHFVTYQFRLPKMPFVSNPSIAVLGNGTGDDPAGLLWDVAPGGVWFYRPHGSMHDR